MRRLLRWCAGAVVMFSVTCCATGDIPQGLYASGAQHPTVRPLSHDHTAAGPVRVRAELVEHAGFRFVLLDFVLVEDVGAVLVRKWVEGVGALPLNLMVEIGGHRMALTLVVENDVVSVSAAGEQRDI